MSKRSNQDSQQDLEPAAKRLANQNENEIDIVAEQKLQAARTAFARLDYKNTQQLCTELIDASYCDPSAPLTLRSLNSEKQGYLASSLEDAKRALKLKESKKAHLRCSFAYLAHALHHLERAQKESEDDQEESYSVSGVEIQELSHQIGGLKSLEDGKPFRTRVSEYLLLQMASFFDSPSLAIFSATSKGLRTSIQGSKELFRVFKMSGKGKNLTAGIEFFSRRCGNSIRSIDIEVKYKLAQKRQISIQRAISLSSSTLKQISIRHRGDLCHLIIQVASLSPSLKILSSTNTARGLARVNNQSLKVPSSWKVELTKLVWDGGAESLVCDDTLLKSLQSAEEVVVYSDGVYPSWVLNLLSSVSSTLVRLNIPRIRSKLVDELPNKIELPNLEFLRLGRVPQSRSTQVSFFNILHAPNLRCLCLEAVSIKDLSSFPPEIPLTSFTAFGLLKDDGTLALEAVEEEATSFVKAIKDWKELRTLDLTMEKSTSPSFYTRLIELLTPLSQTSVENDYGNRFLLPKLHSLVLGAPDASNADTPISASKLATFVGTRLASWQGFSSDQISSIAAGDLSQIEQEPQGTPFAPAGTYSLIAVLQINIPFKVDDETLSWLEDCVPSMKLKHRVA